MTRVPAGTHQNLENLGTAGYWVPGKFKKLGTAGYRVPSKFWKLGTAGYWVPCKFQKLGTAGYRTVFETWVPDIEKMLTIKYRSFLCTHRSQAKPELHKVEIKNKFTLTG